MLLSGTFRQTIFVMRPDLWDEEILHVHAKDKPLAKDVDLAEVAKMTPGFTGQILRTC